MLSPPEHPGKPQWRTHDEWLKTRESQAINMPMNEAESRAAMLERFGLLDDSRSRDGWSNEPSSGSAGGWGAPPAHSDNGGW